MTVLDTQETYIAESYPYGGKRTQASFSVEFKKKMGFRSVFQTVNPTTNRMNAPKKGTYADLITTIQEENGHYDWLHFRVNGNEEIIKCYNFIADNFAALNMTSDMHSHIISTALMSFKYGLAWIKFESAEAKTVYLETYLKPIMAKMVALQKNPSAEGYKEVVVLVESIAAVLKTKVTIS